MTSHKSNSPSRKGAGAGDAGKGEKPMTTPHSPNIFKFGAYEAGGSGKTKKVPIDVKEKKGGSSDDEWEPFPMDDFEKALPYDPNKPKVGPAAKTYPLGITHPFDRYANPSNPGNVPPSSFYYNNKKPKLTKQKVSKQEKTEQYYSQERLDSIRSEHLNSAKPIEGDIEDMDERFPKFKNKNHRKKTELDKQVPRFKEDKKDKKSYDTGFYTINEGFGTFHGTLKKEDIPEEEKPEAWQVTDYYNRLAVGCTPSQLAMKHCKCDTPHPVKGMEGYCDS